MIILRAFRKKEEGKQNMFSLVLQCFRVMGKRIGWYENVYDFVRLDEKQRLL